MPKENLAFVRDSPVAGKGLFASRPIPCGSQILSIDRPLVGTLDRRQVSTHCSNCFRLASSATIDGSTRGTGVNEIKACTGCHVVGYCGKRCQSEAWKRYHKLECKFVGKKYGNALTSGFPIHTVAEILKRKAYGLLDDGDWEDILKLESHVSERRARENLLPPRLRTSSAAQETRELASLDSFSAEDVEGIFARVMNNALHLIEPTLDPIGCCFDPLLAKANHCCDPNAVVVMDGPQVSFRSIKPIKEEEEITLAYVDVSERVSTRRRKLRDQYFFECKCFKCERELHDSVENGWLQPLAELPKEWAEAADQFASYDSNWKCGNIRPEVDRMFALESVATTYAAVEPGMDLSTHALPVKSAQSAWEDGLRICSLSKMWPIDRQPWPHIRQNMIAEYIDSKRYSDAFMLAANGYFFVDPSLYPNPAHPVRIVHTWTLATLAIYLADAREQESNEINAMKLLGMGIDFGVFVFGLLYESRENVQKSHGKDSRFAKEVFRKFDEVKTDITRGDPSMLEHMFENMEPCFSRLKELMANIEAAYYVEKIKYAGDAKEINEAIRKRDPTGPRDALHPSLFAPSLSLNKSLLDEWRRM